MGFRQVLEHSDMDLTASDHRIASILLAAPQDCAFLSAAQLAERSSVHESTVIRFAQKLGYSGYPELRADLAVDVKTLNESATQRWIRAAEAYELTTIVQSQLRTLSQLPDHVSQEAIDSAARAILRARKVFLYGQDFARPLVEFIERKLRFMGFDVVALSYSGQHLAERMVGFTTDDVLLAFAFQDQRRDIVRLLSQAHADGLVTILITDHSSVMMKLSPTHLLAAPRSFEGRNTILVPLVISYGLEYALMHLAPERIGPALERFNAFKRVAGIDSEWGGILLEASKTNGNNHHE